MEPFRKKFESAGALVFPEICPLCGGDADYPGGHFICKQCLKELYFLTRSGCRICGRPLVSEKEICLKCRDGESFIDGAYAFFEYKGKGKELLYQYKFKGHRNIGLFFAEILAEYIRERGLNLPVVPVPVRRKSLKKRGWDPVGHMAGILERDYGIPGRNLLRRLPSKAQKELGLEKRAENIRNRFVFTGKEVSERVYLLDDVFTTGATVNECARILKSSGCREVKVITICRD